MTKSDKIRSSLFIHSPEDIDTLRLHQFGEHHIGNNWMMIALVIVTVECEVTMVMTWAVQYTAIQIVHGSLHYMLDCLGHV